MRIFLSDIKCAARKLFRTPGFTLVAVLTLALGIGANSAIFSMVNAVKYRAMPVPHPEQLRNLTWFSKSVFVWVRDSYIDKLPDETWTSDAFHFETYAAMQEKAESVSDVMAMARSRGMVVRTDQRMAKAEGLLVSGNCFQGWQLKALKGRVFEPADDEPSAEPVTVISYDSWDKQFDKTNDVIGKNVVLNDVSYRIIGVLPRDFHGPYAGTDIGYYVPASTQPLVDPHHTTGYEVMVRLKPGISEAQALSELTLIYCRAMFQQDTSPEPLHLEMEDTSRGRVSYSKSYAKPLPLLMGMVGIVLLLTCLNLAGLLLVRGIERQRDLSICQAMGAMRRQLMRPLIAEALVLAVLGAGAGLLLASYLKQLLARLLWSPGAAINLGTDWRVLGFTALLTILTMLLFGLLPALYATRTDFCAFLKEKMALGGTRMRLGRTLVVLQVALSLVLLTGAGLLARTLMNINNIPSGFSPEHLLGFYINPETSGYKDEVLDNMHRQIQSALAELPGVESFSYSQGIALRQGSMIWSLGISAIWSEQHPEQPKLKYVIYKNVGPDYLSTLGIPLLYGRDFTVADNSKDAPRVVIINEHLAQILFGDENPLGQPMPFNGAEIIGVCKNFKNQHIKEAAGPLMLLPCSQNARQVNRLGYVVRTTQSPKKLMPQIVKAVRNIDPNLLVEDIETQNDSIRAMTRGERLFALLSCGLAAIAISLSCLGLYGLLSYQVARRTREIGVRLALGATPRQILLPFLRSGFLMGLVGVIIGLPCIYASTKYIRSRLWGIEANDLPTIIASCVALVLITVLAAYIPARRASKVDPMEALRYE
ncbi:MAG: ABC transporter permease [Pontiellaceae bacterium]|nr:ABC transporter permease [Pontiellaceae bacterium]